MLGLPLPPPLTLMGVVTLPRGLFYAASVVLKLSVEPNSLVKGIIDWLLYYI